jgi:hypothetical protein
MFVLLEDAAGFPLVNGPAGIHASLDDASGHAARVSSFLQVEADPVTA